MYSPERNKTIHMSNIDDAPSITDMPNTKDVKVGFLGFGTMAQAIMQGWLRKNVVDPRNIIACAAHYEKLETNCAKYGINPAKAAEEVVDFADVVIVAVKPYQVESVFAPAVGLLVAHPDDIFVVSLAAGCLFGMYEEVLGETSHHISTIPNTPISIANGVVVAEEKHSLTDEQLAIFMALFESVSTVEFVDSEHLSVAGTVAGCGPAYAAMFIEALGDAGVKHGLQRATAYRLASAMLRGTSALQLETGQHPGVMKDAVCSPGGTTIQGVASLESNGFRGTIIAAIDAVEESR